MSDIWLYLALALTVAALVVAVPIIVFIIRKRSAVNDLRYDFVPTAKLYSRITYEEVSKFGKKRGFSSQSDAYRKIAQEYGHKIAAGGVSHVVFVHGTFMGDDPVGMLKHFLTWIPNGQKLVGKAAELVMDVSRHNLARDVGNFTPSYVRLWRDTLPEGLVLRNFRWSSENHHAARVRGAIALLDTLWDLTHRRPAPRILLIGHSHAAQLFALLSHLLTWTPLAERVAGIMGRDGVFTAQQRLKAKDLGAIPIDFITLGAPLMYSWNLSSRQRLLHVINHRGPLYGEGPNIEGSEGLLTTKGGDYVQLFGILGSDFPAFSQADRQLNVALDGVLGRGRDLPSWRQNFQFRCRISPYGQTVLVDYQDQGGRLPNLFSTFFGHGIYTRYRTALFLMKLIAERLY